MLPNTLACVDAVRGMRALPLSSVKLTVTSPPYDSTFEYGGHLWDHEKFMMVAHELWRVTSPGGVVCWVVRDQIIGGSHGHQLPPRPLLQGAGVPPSQCHRRRETDRSWDQQRPLRRSPGVRVRLLEGEATHDESIRDKPNKFGGQEMRFSTRSRDGTRSETAKVLIKPFGVRGNVWRYTTGSRVTAGEGYAFDHPALMPEALARDLITSWSRPGDVVLDCFGGAGTTAKMSLLNDRRYHSLEVHEPYHELALRRLSDAHRSNDERLDILLTAQQ